VDNDECSARIFPHLNTRDWFARSHPSKEENRTIEIAAKVAEAPALPDDCATEIPHSQWLGQWLGSNHLTV
jgi:hypothetical protein